MSIIIVLFCLYFLWFTFYYTIFLNTGIEISPMKKSIYNLACDLKPLLYAGLIIGWLGIIISSIMLCRYSILKETVEVYKENPEYEVNHEELKRLEIEISYDKLWKFIL